MRPVLTLLAAVAVTGCTASSGDPAGPIDAAGFHPADADTRQFDGQPTGPDAKTIECPPGLPSSFGDLGNVSADTNKNGPPTFDTYNVFIDLEGNPRWFFVINLWPDRGVFSGGIEEGKTYEIIGEDTDEPHCSLCINLFADEDTTEGGPSQHMFAQKGRLIVTDVTGDAVSGRLEDILLQAIEIVYDDESPSCSDDIDDPVCENSICLNNHCGRQQDLAGCTTAIEAMSF